MTPPRRARAAACLLTGLLVGLLTGVVLGVTGAPAQGAEDAADPLRVVIDGVDPATIPAKGPLRVTGTIRNTSQSDWTDLQAYLLISPEPLRTRAELDDAASSEPDTYFGDRLASEGQYDNTITDLGPGQSARFEVVVRRKDLDTRISGTPGVYQLGIQVLGAQDGAREDGADGRARTLITLMPQKNPPTTALGVIVQVRAPVSYDSSGKPLSPDRWNHLLSAQGRLGRLLSLAGAGSSFPFSFLVDPAVPDMANELALGSPGYDLSLGRKDAEPSQSPSPSDAASDSAAPDVSAGSGDRTAGAARSLVRPMLPAPDPDDPAVSAKAWLTQFRDDAANQSVLTLPYGDVDVEAAYAARSGRVVAHALKTGGSRLSTLGITGSSVIAPPDGILTATTSGATADLAPQILGASQVDAQGTRVDTSAGAHLTIADDVFSNPDAALDRSALQVRQRVIAEAAVHGLGEHADEPLIVTLPSRWDPGVRWERSHFFDALASVPWLTGTSPSGVVRSPLTDGVAESSVLPTDPPDSKALVPPGNFAEAATLERVAGTLDTTLDRDGEVSAQFDRYADLATSVQFRPAPLLARFRAAAITASVRSTLDQVTVSGPSFVTMSSEEGRFQATITNSLDEPVVVGVHADTGTDRLTIDDAAPVRVEPGQHRTVTMRASSNDIGVWPVTLRIVNSAGDQVSEPEFMRLRSSHVSRFIWVIIGVGTLVLLAAIVVRTRRKWGDHFGHGSGVAHEATSDVAREPTSDAIDEPTSTQASDHAGRSARPGTIEASNEASNEASDATSSGASDREPHQPTSVAAAEASGGPPRGATNGTGREPAQERLPTDSGPADG